MLLITSIPPRRDGNVVAGSACGRRNFVFAPDAEGQLACDVDDDATVALLLRTENFFPANEGDFGRALEIAKPEGEDDGEGADKDAEDDADDGADDEGSADGAPLEAGTQPVIATPAAVRRARNRG